MEKSRSEKIMAQDALQKKGAQPNSTVESAGDAVYILRTDNGRIVNCNSQARLELGYSRDELVKLSAKDIETKLVSGEIDAIHNDLQPGEVKTIAGMHKRKDGSVFPVEIHLASLAPTQADLMVAVVSNITERLRTEEERRRNIERIERLADEMGILAETGRVISSTLEIDKVYECIAAEIAKLIRFDSLLVNLFNAQDETLKVVYNFGMDTPGRRVGESYPLRETVSEAVAETRRGVIAQSETPEGLLDIFPGLVPASGIGMRSILVVPLISRDELIGSLAIRSVIPFAYTERDLLLAEKIGMQIAAAINNARLYSSLKQAEEELKEHKKALEETVRERTNELEIKNITLEELNTTLKVLIKQREDDKRDLEERFVMNVRNLVLPFVHQIKKGRLVVGQQPCLEIIETYLLNIATPFLKNLRQFNLTPKELKVAALVRNGRKTKEIAEALGIATGSIDIHRNNIRKKLGLNSRKANLQSVLETLTQ
ncbi:MAG: PAS domain S-box protein [Deltaproteobacteria bacterium]|nr:PAS domain S-box protein [Deltaproteobacteria bacterium]